MAQCEGITNSGEQCKLEAQEDSRFCHLHGENEEVEGDAGAEANEGPTAEEPETGGESAEPSDEDEALSWDDVAHLALAGVVVVGMFFFVRTFDKWMPKI